MRSVYAGSDKSVAQLVSGVKRRISVRTIIRIKVNSIAKLLFLRTSDELRGHIVVVRAV